MVQDDLMISLEELGKRQSQGENIFVVDTRDRPIFAEDHLLYAHNIPFDELSVRGLNEIPGGAEIIIVGGSVEENAFAYDLLSDQGFTGMHILDGEL